MANLGEQAAIVDMEFVCATAQITVGQVDIDTGAYTYSATRVTRMIDTLLPASKLPNDPDGAIELDDLKDSDWEKVGCPSDEGPSKDLVIVDDLTNMFSENEYETAVYHNKLDWGRLDWGTGRCRGIGRGEDEDEDEGDFELP